MAVLKKRDEYQKEAMKMYGVSLQAGDTRSESVVMREVYLDFYSKSLVQQDTKPDTCSYSKRLQEEQKEHKLILEKIMKGHHYNTYKHHFEFDNGDPSIDPRLKIEEKLTNK